jgi:hypothetical protein
MANLDTTNYHLAWCVINFAGLSGFSGLHRQHCSPLHFVINAITILSLTDRSSGFFPQPGLELKARLTLLKLRRQQI